MTTIENVPEKGSWLGTIQDRYNIPNELILVLCDGGIEAWVNRCTHKSQRLDQGPGATIRNGEIVCPKCESRFDTCTGYCDNGKAADTNLLSVEITVNDRKIYLSDNNYDFLNEGRLNEKDMNSAGSYTF